VTAGNAVLLWYSRQLVGSCTINDLFRTDLEFEVHMMDNIKNANYSLSAAQIYCKLSVSTALFICFGPLTCINICLDSCLLATDRINMLVFISVDVRLQYFVQYVSLKSNFISVYVRLQYFVQYVSLKSNFISVYVRLRYFVQYSISVNINFIQFPRCFSLFWHYERKWLF
jgi:hypothetical protein